MKHQEVTPPFVLFITRVKGVIAIFVLSCVFLVIGLTNVLTHIRTNIQQSSVPQPPITGSLWSVLGKEADHARVSATMLRAAGDRKPSAVSSPNLLIEVVNTPASLEQGLSDRQELGADGMIFVLPRGRQLGFWMKDMQFGLDFLWLNEAGKVIGIDPHVAPPQPPTCKMGQKECPASPTLELLTPPAQTALVLEVKEGQSEVWGVTVGDQLMLSGK